mmetsp:Transcript_12195/g.26381  ORF Transcript_12195/g.26381 Transcript_12195/m.26381 type:complete len:379 (+) Transcript_12195:195-1331(+)
MPKLKNPFHRPALGPASHQGIGTKAGKGAAGEKTTLLPASSSDVPRSTPDAKIRALPRTGESGLTADFVGYANSQDAVWLCVACIVLYLCLAILAFSVVFESWSIVDSLYYAVVTFTTIGYGDLSPTTTAGKSFAIAFSLFGVAIVGVALGIVGEMVVDYQKEAAEKLKQGGKKRIMAMLKKNERDNYFDQDDSDKKDSAVWGDLIGIIKSDGWLVMTVVVCSVGIGYYENWPLIDSLYYCAITTTTVGYGDLTPSEEGTRLFSILFLPFAVVVLAKVLGGVAGVYLDSQARKMEREFLRRELTLRDLAVMDENCDGSVQMGEFLSFMLVAMQKVSEEDVQELKDLFHHLDADGGGTLQKEDLMILASRKSANSAEIA